MCFFCRLGPTCRALFMVTLLGRFCLLTLSYLATKDCPFGNVTRCRVYAYRLSCRGFLPPNNAFLITGPAIVPNAGPANEPNIGIIGRNPSSGMRHRSDVSFWSHLSWDVAYHIGTSLGRRYWYVNETDLFGNLPRRLTGS